MSVIAIWGAPQSGKTTIGLNMAHALSRNGHSVLLVSPEEYSELSMLTGVNIPPEKSLIATLNGRENLKKYVSEVSKNLYILAAATNGDSFEMIVSDTQAKEFFSTARLLFDVVIIDCPTEKNNLIAAWAINKADFVLMVYGGKITHGLWSFSNFRALAPIRNKSICVINETTRGFDYESLKKGLRCEDSAMGLPYVPDAQKFANEQKIIFGNGGGKSHKRYTKAMEQLILRVVKV